MLRLILGRAKSGKTAAAMEAIRARMGTGHSVLLVPEQYSHEAETELLRVCGAKLSLWAEVLSFTRLWSRVEEELGLARGAALLDKGGRRLCLARALSDVGGRLRVFQAARRQIPIQQALLRAVDECAAGRVSPEMLEKAAKERPAGDALGLKLRDLSLICGAYDAIAAQSGLDPARAPDLLAEHIGESRYAGSRFFIDGFTDFTAQENAVVEALLRVGAEVTVCLTAAGLEEGHEIFEPARRAAARLRDMAASAGAPCEIEERKKAAGDGPMAFLEREMFAFGDAAMDGGGAVELRYASCVGEECEYAAARCLELLRETGCRSRDIAIAARSFETYRAALEGAFAQYGVPLYLAKKSDVLSKPLPALIAAAYDTVTGGWDFEDVMCYLKTGLAGLDTAERDALENYAFLWSLRGKAWAGDEDWTLHPDGFGKEFDEKSGARLKYINGLRRRATAPLRALYETGAAAETAAGQARALAEFFERLNLPKILQKRADELEALGYAQDAAEYAQLWDITLGALDQCVHILGDAEMDTETFGKLFTMVLSAYDVGSIPLSLDRVSAGDMDRMRRRRIRHLIVLGCDSETLPSATPPAGVFSDADREALAEAGLPLGDAAAARLDREFALMYNCLTLPSETLSLSWCTSAKEGGRAQSAFIVTRAEKIFQCQAAPVDVDACRESAPGPAFRLAAGAKRAFPTPGAGAARRWFLEQGAEQEQRLDRLERSAALTRGRLSRSAVRALYGAKPRLTASRADKLAACPFGYFMQYGLKAKPRQAAEFRPPEMGNFLHYVLEHAARDIQTGPGFKKVTRAQVEALCDKYVERYVHETLWDFRQKSQRFIYLFRRLIKDVRAVVTDMVEELRRGDFVPLEFELNFGDGRRFAPIELGDGDDTVALTGVVDRVDGWVHEGKLYLRVVDYKTGKKSFSLSEVWYGMGLQMLLYLFALCRGGFITDGQTEVVPAGVLYVPAREPSVPGAPGMSMEDIQAEKAKQRRRSGLILDLPEVIAAMERLTGEDGKTRYLPVTLKKDGSWGGDALATAERFGLLAKHIDATLASLAKELRAGSIAADPWFRTQTENACRFCDYASACHFDETKDNIRYMPALRASQVWEKLEGGADQ